MPFENLLNISVKKDYIDYLSALLTPTIAIAGLYIAFNHKRIEEARLRHELFERRWKQFDAVKSFVYNVTNSGIADNNAEQNFLGRCAGMEFIFSEEIAKFVKTYIYDLSLNIKELQYEISDINNNSNSFEMATMKSKREKKIILLQKNLDVFQEKISIYMQLQQVGFLRYILKHSKQSFKIDNH